MFPMKLQTGQKFKPIVVERINDIIDYLRTQRIIVDGKTIKADQLASGLALHAITQPSANGSGGGGGGKFEHPFKLSIGQVENVGKVLNIKKGRISLNGDDESRIYVCFQPNDQGFLEYVPLPQQEGTFQINLLIFYDIATQSENQDFWQIRVVYNELSNAHDFVQSCGMFHFLLGYVEVTEDEDENLNYQIFQPTLTSGFAVYDCNIIKPFKAFYGVSTYPSNGDVITNDIVPTKIVVNAGAIFLDSIINTNAYTLNNPTNDTLIIATINVQAKTATISNVAKTSYVYNPQDNVYNIPICQIDTDGASAYGIIQYIDNDFAFGIDTYMVKFQQTDTPLYLPDKFATDSTVSSVIQLQKNYTTNRIILKSALGQSTDALIIARNGNLNYISYPTSGKYVLTVNNGTFSWVEYADCEDACSSSSSSLLGGVGSL